MSTNPFATPGNDDKNSSSPFGTPPPAPAFEGLGKDDAERGTTIILEVVEVARVTSKFADKNGQHPEQDRLTVNATIVDGPRAGTRLSGQWIYWSRVVGQFRDCAGDGQKYLCHLSMDGRAVVTNPVTDQAVIDKAAALL